MDSKQLLKRNRWLHLRGFQLVVPSGDPLAMSGDVFGSRSLGRGCVTGTEWAGARDAAEETSMHKAPLTVKVYPVQIFNSAHSENWITQKDFTLYWQVYKKQVCRSISVALIHFLKN